MKIKNGNKKMEIQNGMKNGIINVHKEKEIHNKMNK
jgi:predicted transcriptional regulator